jgi:hypothetical protein
MGIEAMTDESNPYSPPVTPSNAMPELRNGLPGRLGVCAVGGIFSLIALQSLVTFVLQLRFLLPGGPSYVQAEPMWVFAHLVRGVGLSILTWQLFRYATVIGRIATKDDLRTVARRHAALWNWGAFVLFAIMAYSLGAVVAMMSAYV